MPPNLEHLLIQLRDGTVLVRETVLERVRALVRADDRIPADLHDVMFVDPAEASSDAGALLGMLGLDDLGARIAAAIHAELEESETELADALAAGEAAWGPIGAAVDEAVRMSAGRVELVDGVFAQLGVREQRYPLREAMAAAAGPVDVADAVLAAVGLTLAPVAIPVAPRVSSGRAIPLSTRASRGNVRNPAPAAWTRRWMVAGTALAAAAALLLTFGRLSGDAAMVDGHHLLPPAMAGEVVIEDLVVGSGVEVIEMEGADGSVILWVDEEA